MTATGRLARSALAVFLTTVSSSLIASLAIAVSHGHPYEIELIAILWMFGSMAAAIPAIVLGAAVEWPKSNWATQNPHVGVKIYALISTIAAVALMLAYTLLSQLWHIPTSRNSSDLAEAYAFVAAMGAIGGMCSAVWWWVLVVAPLRRQQRI